MKTQRQLMLATGRRALFRIAEGARRELEKLVFSRHPAREWGAFFQFGYRKTTWGVAISYVMPIPPMAGDLDRQSSIVSFRPDYIDRAVDRLQASSLGMGVIHSHPLGIGVVPSPLDDDMDCHFAAEMFGAFAPDRPYVSLIVNRDEAGGLQFSGRAFLDGEWLPVTTLFSAGDELLRIENDLLPARSVESEASRAILARWISMVGDATYDGFRRATIGVIGCSGTGSPAVEMFARAQVGGLVLIDPKRASLSNLERLHGTVLADLANDTPPYKVEAMARMIRDVNPDAELTLIVGSSMDPLAIDELLRCDLILVCTDSVHGRVHAGDLASRFLVPCVDVGVLPVPRAGKLATQLVEFMKLTPDGPCPFCRQRVDQEVLHRELLSPEAKELAIKEHAEALRRGESGDAYWRGELPQLPSVGYLTTAAGALAAGYALNWLLGTASMPHDHFQMDVGAPGFGFVPIDSEVEDGCSCLAHRGHGDQGDASVTMPSHFTPAQILETFRT